MESERKFWFWMGLAIVFFIGLVWGAVELMHKYELGYKYTDCKARWAQSDRKSHYDRHGGCLVESKPGIFIPERYVRPEVK